MRVLLPFLTLYRRHWFLLSLGIVLAIVTLLASISLLSLSGWFLAASAVAGVAGLVTFNYMLPAAGVRGFAITRTAGRYAERVVSHEATFRVLTHLRVFVFEKILPLSPGGIARFRQADLLNRLVADVDTLDHLYLRVLSPLMSALVIILLVTWGLSWLDGTLALLLGGTMLCLLLLFPPLFYRAGKPIGEQLTALRSDYRQQLIYALRGQAELTIFGAQARFRHALDQRETQWLQCQQQQVRLSSLAQGWLILLTGCMVTLMLWCGAEGIGEVGYADASVALLVFTTLAAFEALLPVANAFQHLGHVVASARRVKQVMDQPAEVIFPPCGPAALAEVSLAVEGVSFTYPGQPQAVLNTISLTLAPGEHLVLLGRTGCGKSTLLQLLSRAWENQRGAILFNGYPLSTYDEATLRQMIGVVTQRVHLFNATLRDNLLLSAPQASDAELTRVLQQVGLDILLENQGLNSWLGEGGRPLSGGEQRRLGIARVLLHAAPLLLLDEPTEGLDAETEHQILQLLKHSCHDKSIIMVTHRLTGLEQWHRICVMDDGQIVEQGDHQTLMQQQGRYYQLTQQVNRVAENRAIPPVSLQTSQQGE